MFKYNRWTNIIATEFPSTMHSKVLGRQQDPVPKCISNIPMPSIGILLLVRLRLKQMMLNHFTNFLPGLHLVLRSL